MAPGAAPGSATLPADAGEYGPRVALFAEPGAEYVAGQFATWLHRGISVPLCLSHPDRRAAAWAVVAGAFAASPLRFAKVAPALPSPARCPSYTLFCCCHRRCRELQYVLEDAQVSALLASERHAERLYRLAQARRCAACIGSTLLWVDEAEAQWLALHAL